MLLVENDGIWTIYTSERTSTKHGNFIGKFIKFIDNILEYFILGADHCGAFIYKTKDGWYFFFVEGHSWYIASPNVLKKRINSIKRICDADVKVFPYEGVDPKNGVVVDVNGKPVFLYSYLGNVFDKFKDEFEKFDGIKPIEGYHKVAKVYPDESHEMFYIKAFCSWIELKHECYDKLEPLGQGYFVAYLGENKKLIHISDEKSPVKVIIEKERFDKVTRVTDSWCGNLTVWYVERGKASYIFVQEHNIKIPTSYLKKLIIPPKK
jgi:hypothetical protein